MINKGLGQYDLEYSQCSCFWGIEPGKFVKQLCNSLNKGEILDLGAGEGKNAIYLAERGFEVTAVECSKYAIKNFQYRLKSLSPDVRSRIEIINADVKDFKPVKQFNAVVAYGLLHCLPNTSIVYDILNTMKSWTVKNGYNVIATFTNRLPVPNIQHYLNPTLISGDLLKNYYKDWKLIAYEHGILEETHPTTKIIHQHSICRMISRKGNHGRKG